MLKCHSRSESYRKQENTTTPPYFASSIVQLIQLFNLYNFSPYICSPYAYLIYAHLINAHLINAHLIHEVHSADSKTDKGALHQPEKPNSGEIQPFNQKGRRMIKGFEAKLLQKVHLLAPKVLLEDL